jgi:hypothetical protein
MQIWHVLLNLPREVRTEMTEPATETPNIIDAIRAVLQEDFDETVEFNRLELRITQGGAVPYRLFPRDGSDYVGGTAFVEVPRG